MIAQQIVDWHKRIVWTRPSGRREGRYWVECGTCGHTRLLSKSNATKAESNNSCKICHTRRAGKKGFAAAITNGSWEKTMDKLRQWRLDNPSNPERVVMYLLDRLGIEAEREVRFERWCFDFVLDCGKAIEVNGYWHKLKRGVRDCRLQFAYQKPILFLDENVILGDEAEATRLIMEFVNA